MVQIYQMSIRYYVFSLLELLGQACVGQEHQDYRLTAEEKVLKTSDWPDFDLRNGSVVGQRGDTLWMMARGSATNGTLILYNEKVGRLEKRLPPLGPGSKILSVITHSGNSFVYLGYRAVDSIYWQTDIIDLPIGDFEYQDLWFSNALGQSIVLDRLSGHFFDRSYELQFSGSGKELICNAYTSRTTSYDSTTDGFFMVYDLTGDRAKKKIVPCEQCTKTFLFDNTYFFQRDIPIGGGFDGNHNNIYKSPANNVNDTVRLATDIKLLMITSDRKFAIGGKYLFGRYTAVVLDLAARRFEYLIGRDYLSRPFWYSQSKKKIGFDFGNHIIYVEIPENLRRSSLLSHHKFTTKEEDNIFWRSHAHAAEK